MAEKINFDFPGENLTVKQWCDKLTNEGYELSLCWEGGGDSGWVHFEIDGTEVDNKYTEALVDYCYDVLDYGSWAGEFSAYGSAVYSPKDKAFIGNDAYSEDVSKSADLDVEIRIPKSLWFDRLEIAVDEESTRSQFVLRNGFISEQHQEVLSSIESTLSDWVTDFINDYSEEIRVYVNNFNIPRADFKEDGDDLVYTLDELSYSESEGSDKDVMVEITESVENFLTKLKEKE